MRKFTIFLLIIAAFALVTTSCQTEEEAQKKALEKHLAKMNEEVAKTKGKTTEAKAKPQKDAPIASIGKLEDMAKQGNTNAQLSLGNIYFEGRAGEKQNYRKAFKYYTMAAEGGNPEAMYNLGICYEGGFGILMRDTEKAVQWYRNAAENGISAAQMKLASHYEVLGQPEEAFRYITMLADDGDAAYMYKAGLCLLNANGTPADAERAVEYLQDAAQAEYIPAQMKLADCYRSGTGIAPNLQEMFYWYNLAARAENAEAQTKLGYCYYKGLGIVVNYEKAAFWLKRAADGGSVEAMLMLGYLYRDGVGVDPSEKTALQWFGKAADNDNAEAQYELGMSLLNSKHDEAMEWLRKSGDNGYRRANITRGQLLMADSDPNKREEGHALLMAAIPDASPDEQLQIAIGLLNSDPEVANALIKKSAQGGNREAAAMLP